MSLKNGPRMREKPFSRFPGLSRWIESVRTNEELVEEEEKAEEEGDTCRESAHIADDD